MLLGIVARGSAFAFRSYDARRDFRRRWGTVFATASLLTPVLLGTVIGAVAWGRISSAERLRSFGLSISSTAGLASSPSRSESTPWRWSHSWRRSTFAWMHRKRDLQEDFRRKALISAVFLGVIAAEVLAVASFQAPEILRDLTRTRWSWILHARDCGCRSRNYGNALAAGVQDAHACWPALRSL